MLVKRFLEIKENPRQSRGLSYADWGIYYSIS